jgi:hypothetical protein
MFSVKNENKLPISNLPLGISLRHIQVKDLHVENFKWSFQKKKKRFPLWRGNPLSHTIMYFFSAILLHS